MRRSNFSTAAPTCTTQNEPTPAFESGWLIISMHMNGSWSTLRRGHSVSSGQGGMGPCVLCEHTNNIYHQSPYLTFLTANICMLDPAVYGSRMPIWQE